MSRRHKKDDLDTTTTFADMNVEGFRWYDPAAKKDGGENTVNKKVPRKEYWRMVRGAFVAFLPYFAAFLLGLGVIIALLYLWLS